MSVGLYMDEHVPRAITEGLRLRGVDVLTAQEDNRRRASDSELLDRATELGRILSHKIATCFGKRHEDNEQGNSSQASFTPIR
jgi:hypothetical protein